MWKVYDKRLRNLAGTLQRHLAGVVVPVVIVRVLHRVLALATARTTAVWHDDRTGQPVTRSPPGLRPLTPWSTEDGWRLSVSG